MVEYIPGMYEVLYSALRSPQVTLSLSTVGMTQLEKCFSVLHTVIQEAIMISKVSHTEKDYYFIHM